MNIEMSEIIRRMPSFSPNNEFYDSVSFKYRVLDERSPHVVYFFVIRLFFIKITNAFLFRNKYLRLLLLS